VKDFALPSRSASAGYRKFRPVDGAKGYFPMDTAGRARSARGRAIISLNEGHLSRKDADTIINRTSRRWGLAPGRVTGTKGAYSLTHKNPKRSKTTMAGKSRRTRTYKARRPRRGTRAGQQRKTARRAYRKSARNQRLLSPPVQYAVAAGVGAVLSAAWADSSPMLNPKTAAGEPALPISGGVVAGALTLALAQFGLKGQNRRLAQAAGVGMITPAAARFVTGAITGMGANRAIATGNSAFTAAPRRLSNPHRYSNAAAGFVRSSANAADNLAS